MATRQANRFWAWRCFKIISIMVPLIAALFAGAVWHGLSKMVTRSGKEIPLTTTYVEGLRSAGYNYTPLRVYEATLWDNFHNEGTILTIHKFDPGKASEVAASLEAKWPESTWDEAVAGGSSIGETGAFQPLVPRDWLPPDMSIVRHLKVSERALHYYLDTDRGFLYMRSD